MEGLERFVHTGIQDFHHARRIGQLFEAELSVEAMSILCGQQEAPETLKIFVTLRAATWRAPFLDGLPERRHPPSTQTWLCP